MCKTSAKQIHTQNKRNTNTHAKKTCKRKAHAKHTLTPSLTCKYTHNSFVRVFPPIFLITGAKHAQNTQDLPTCFMALFTALLTASGRKRNMDVLTTNIPISVKELVEYYYYIKPR